MIDYGQQPSNQLQFSLECTKEKKKYDAALKWIDDNPDMWAEFKRLAVEDSAPGSYASAKFIVETLRRKYKKSISNDITSCLARIAMEQDSRIRFNNKKSMFDGLVEVV